MDRQIYLSTNSRQMVGCMERQIHSHHLNPSFQIGRQINHCTSIQIHRHLHLSQIDGQMMKTLVCNGVPNIAYVLCFTRELKVCHGWRIARQINRQIDAMPLDPPFQICWAITCMWTDGPCISQSKWSERSMDRQIHMSTDDMSCIPQSRQNE